MRTIFAALGSLLVLVSLVSAQTPTDMPTVTPTWTPTDTPTDTPTPALTAVVIYIDQANGTNTIGTLGTEGDPFKSITYAFAVMNSRSAPDPWTVYIKAGVYDKDPSKPGDEQEIFPIQLRDGMNLLGSDDRGDCVIAGSYNTNSTVALLYGSGLSDISIAGLTLRNMVRTGGSKQGGAAELINCSGTIEECVLEGNSAGPGGAIYLSVMGGEEFHIAGNSLRNNTATNASAPLYRAAGGALYIAGGDVEISDNTFVGNIADYAGNNYDGWGGAIYVAGSQTRAIRNNVLISNVARAISGYPGGTGTGGAIYVSSSLSGGVVENTFSNNQSYCSNGSGYGGCLYVQGSLSGTIARNTFSKNSSTNNGGAIYLAYDGGDAAVVANNLFLHNTITGSSKLLGASVYTEQNISLVNNTLTGGGSGASVVNVMNTASATSIVNNIFLNMDKAIWEQGELDLVITNNTFYGITDILYRNGSGMGNALFLIEIMLTNCQSNSDASPQLVGETVCTGSWTASPTFDFSSKTTTLTDSSKNWVVGEWEGALLNASGAPADRRHCLVVTSTTTTLTVRGDLASTEYVDLGDSYSMDDYHLSPSSPCLDSGASGGSVPTDDYEGDPRPVNGITDVGADEYNRPNAPVITTDGGNGIGMDYETLEPDLTLNGTCDSSSVGVYVNNSELDVSYTPGSTVWSFSTNLKYGPNAFRVVSYNSLDRVSDSDSITVTLTTPTHTPTITPTYTFTNTPSWTPTDTPTPTLTPTHTPMDTLTSTWTPTDTPSATLTPTDTSSHTPTHTFTNTPSWTPTNAPTSTWTPTDTPTATLTLTDIPTRTITNTPSWTPTDMPTATWMPTDTPTNSPTHTLTDTPSWTATDTPTSTPTFTHSPTDTATNTLTNTPTDTPAFPAQRLLDEDWESGEIQRSKWNAFGVPPSRIVAGFGQESFALDADGDDYCPSGVLSVPSWSLVQGQFQLVFEVNTFADEESRYFGAVTHSVGISSATHCSNIECEPEGARDVLFGLWFRLQEEQGTLSMRGDALLGVTPESIPYTSDEDARWQQYHLNVNASGMFSLLKEELVIFQGEVDLSVLTDCVLSIQGSSTYCNILTDNIVLTGSADVNTPTYTPTNTSTYTPTATNTLTDSPTSTPTQTPTSNNTATHTPTSRNEPPTLAGAKIWPDPGIVGRELKAVGLGFYDPEGAPAQFKYKWYVNGVEVEGITENTLPPIFFQINDVVSVLVYPFDGQNTGQPRSDSVRITRGGFTLSAMPQEQAVVAGYRCEYVLSVVPDLPQEMSVTMSLFAGDTSGLQIAFAPENVSLVPQQVMGLTILTVDVHPQAQPGTRMLIVQGSMPGFQAQTIISLKILDPAPGSRSLSLNASRPQVQVRQYVQFSGEIQPLVANAAVNIVLSGDYIAGLPTKTDAYGRYQMTFQPVEPGTVNVTAHFVGENVFSRQVTVDIVRSTLSKMFLATDATGDEKPGDKVNVYGHLAAVSLDETAPPVELGIVQEAFDLGGGGLAAARLTQETTQTVSVSPDGVFSASVEVGIDSGHIEIEGTWPGNALNESATASPLFLMIGSAQIEKRGLLALGDLSEQQNAPSLVPLHDFQFNTLLGRGIKPERIFELSGDSLGLNELQNSVRKMKGGDLMLLSLVGRGQQEGLLLHDGQLLTPSALGDMIKDVTGVLVVAIDADHASSFAGTLVGLTPTGSRRVFITSAGIEQQALFAASGLWSFTGLFSSAMRQSFSIEDCFRSACSHFQLLGTLTSQTPQIISVNINPAKLVFGTPFGTGVSDLMPPVVLSVDAPSTVRLGDRIAIAADVLETSDIALVRSVITTGCTRYTWEQEMFPSEAEPNRYETAPIIFDETGNYSISLLFVDQAGNMSDPETMAVGVTGEVRKGDLNGDGIIDQRDFLLLSSHWMRRRTEPGYNNLADCNDDQIVDAQDLLMMIQRK